MVANKQAGMGDNFYIGGVDLSGDTNSLSRISSPRGALDVTPIKYYAHERLLSTKDGAIDWTSYFNPTVVHPALAALPRTDVVLSYFRGTAIGNAAACMIGKQISYDPNRGNDGSLTFGVASVSNGFGLEWGEQLTAGIRTDTTATSPATGLDGVAVSTAFGLQMYLHVFAVTGTSVTVKLQDSANNSAFTDVTGATFVAATGAGAQRVAVTGTVRRYVRAITTGTFSNAQFAVSFVRNPLAVTF